MRKTTVKKLRKDFGDTHTAMAQTKRAWRLFKRRYLQFNRPDRVRYLEQIA